MKKPPIVEAPRPEGDPGRGLHRKGKGTLPQGATTAEQKPLAASLAERVGVGKGPVDGRAVEAFAQMAARWFVARGAPSRLMDEMQSAAALAVVDTHRRYGLPLVRGNRGYYFMAAKRAVAEEIKQSMFPYRLGGRLSKRGIFTIPAVVSAEELAEQLGGAPDPEEVLEEAARRAALERLMDRLLDEARRASKTVRHQLVPILRARPMPMVMQRHSKNATWNRLMRLGRAVARDPAARRDRGVMIGKDLAA